MNPLGQISRGEKDADKHMHNYDEQEDFRQNRALEALYCTLWISVAKEGKTPEYEHKIRFRYPNLVSR